METENKIYKAFLFKAEHLAATNPDMGTFSDKDMENAKGKMMGINIIGLAYITKRRDLTLTATVKLESRHLGLACQITEMATYDNIDIAVPVGEGKYMICHGLYKRPEYALDGYTMYVNTIGPNGTWCPQTDIAEWEEDENGEMHNWFDRFY